MNFVDQIYDFNHEAGLVSRGYFDFLESSFQIEEALEGFDLTQLWATLEGFSPDIAKAANLSADLHSSVTAKLIARRIMHHALGVPEFCPPEDLRKPILSDVDRLDKACDAIVFAFGSIFKLGLTPDQASRAVSAVMSANLAKLSMPKDSFGKLTKPADFEGPEPILQSILDERSS